MSAQFESVKTFFQNRHINVSDAWLRTALNFLSNKNVDVNVIKSLAYEQWLYSDVRSTTSPSFQVPAGKIFGSIAVLQVESVLNIAKPFVGQLRALEKKENGDLDIFTENDENEGKKFDNAPKEKRMFKFVLTDGKVNVTALEHVSNPAMTSSIKPGCKVIVTKCQYRNSMLLLTPNNCQFLGGYVKSLVEKNNTLALIKRMPLIQNNQTQQKQLNPTKNAPVDNSDRKRKASDISNGPSTSNYGASINGYGSTNGTGYGSTNGTGYGSTNGTGPAAKAPVKIEVNKVNSRISANSSLSNGHQNPPLIINTSSSISSMMNKPSTSKLVNGTNSATRPTTLRTKTEPSQVMIEVQKRGQTSSMNSAMGNSATNQPTSFMNQSGGLSISTQLNKKSLIEPSSISAQLKMKQRRNIAATQANNTPTVPPNKEAAPRQVIITPKKPTPQKLVTAVTTINNQEFLTTPHGTTLSMENFAVPRLQNPPKVDTPVQPKQCVAAVAPRIPPQNPTTPVAVNQRQSITPNSAKSNMSVRENECPSCEEMAFRCKHCMIAFQDRALYQIHAGYHGFQSPFTCNCCGHVATAALDFNLHLYQH